MSKQTIVELTEGAAKHIAHILAAHHNALGFRLSVKATGCSGYRYVPSVVTTEIKTDVRVDTTQGVTVFIDERWLSVLQGTTIDLVDETLGQQRLVFNNPNVVDECGCGESFNVREKDDS